MKNWRFAGIQLTVGADRQKNLHLAQSKISEAVRNGAQVVALPECFTCPYGNEWFPEYAESIPNGPTTQMLSEEARRHSVIVIGGSFPERDGDKIYNTSLVFNGSGEIICKHRKVHLFDICVPPSEGKEGITFKESDALSPGNELSTFDTEFGKFGLGICYDIRFAEMASVLVKRGARFLVYPGAFNLTTGPAHWELLQRARAVDNQVYVAAVSPARNPDSKYQAWGHSTVVDPWGTVVATTDHSESIIYADITPERIEQVRQMIPITLQKRPDLYAVMDKEREATL